MRLQDREWNFAEASCRGILDQPSNHPFRTSLPPITARIAERPVGARISGLGVVGALNEGEFWRKGPETFSFERHEFSRDNEFTHEGFQVNL